MGDKTTCESCKWCILRNYGYSNYTVEGTEFTCAKGCHPDGSFDRFYGEEKRLEYASQCPSYTPGDSVYMDVDMENLDALTPEQLEVWNRAEGGGR